MTLLNALKGNNKPHVPVQSLSIKERLTVDVSISNKFKIDVSIVKNRNNKNKITGF